jgi:molybdate transport system substrate-binding protein
MRVTKTAASAAASAASGLVLLSLFLTALPARAAEIKVVTSGGFTAAYRSLVAGFEKASHDKVITEQGASMGNTPDAIPNRLARGEHIDVVIMVGPALDKLIKEGKVLADSRTELARSRIGMVVKAGAPKPDISTVEAFKQTLLHAKSIAYSDSASGVYLAKTLFAKLGVQDQIKDKCKMIEGATNPVGGAVARGEAEIGFQQVSELLPVPGIDYVGPLPAEINLVTVFSAGIVARSKEQAAGHALLKYLAAPSSAPAIAKTGMEPVAAP